MRLMKYLELALNILLHSKLRSWLTIIGIVIGVAAVVSILSIGQGMQQEMQQRLGAFGADIITIAQASRASRGFAGMPEGGGGFPGQISQQTAAKDLTTQDIQVLRSVPGIAIISGAITSRAEVYYLGEKSTVSIDGVDPSTWGSFTSVELDSGRSFIAADTNVAIIGNRVANGLFKQPIGLEQVMTVAGKPVKVIGILKQSAGFEGTDNKIILPTSSARAILTDVKENVFNTILIKVEDVSLVDNVMNTTDQRLMLYRRVSERKRDYSITSSKNMQERISSMQQALILFLGAIAAISLLVGMVGVANTMFTSVLERTKDIGIMKSIGARNSDIMMIFMFNSAIIGMIGGVFGILLGSAVSLILPSFGMRMMGMGQGEMITALIPFNQMLLIVLLSIIIGIISGVVPAYNASKLSPVEALRYE